MRQQLLLSSLLLGLTLYLGYGVERAEFGRLLLAYVAFFGSYVWVAWQSNHSPTPAQAGDRRWYLGLGILLRVALLFSMPNLSDDFYRFIWDGRLVMAGWDPLAHVPRWFMDNQMQVPGLTPALLHHLNSPDYFTVYPPLCQGVFALATWLSPSSDWGAVVWMKLFLLGCELGTIWLLRHPFAEKDQQASSGIALLYALNPLAILEIVGNCHFEGAMIFLLLLGIRTLQRGQVALGAGAWALATAAKLLPPLWLPLLWRWLGWRQWAWFVAVFVAGGALLFLPPLRWEFVPNLLASLRLYFRQFEFNASVYYLAKSAGWAFLEKNIGRTVGPILGGLTALAVMALAFFKVKPARPTQLLLSAMTLTMGVYLFNATTVHPWYVTVPLVLGIASGWRFPIVWSGVAVLSYSHYLGGGFQEKYGLIALEYGLVWATLLWEVFHHKRPVAARSPS